MADGNKFVDGALKNSHSFREAGHIMWQNIPIQWKAMLFFILALDVSVWSYLFTLSQLAIPVFRDTAIGFPINLISEDIMVSDVLAFILSIVIVVTPISLFHIAFENGLLSDPKSFFQKPGKRLGLLVMAAVFYGLWQLEIWTFVSAEHLKIAELDNCQKVGLFCTPEEVLAAKKEIKARLANAEFYGAIFTAANITLGAASSVVIHFIKEKIK